MPFAAGNLYYIRCSFIVPPHEKISICVCATAPYFFWVNSDPRSHGVAQVPLANGSTAGIVKDCYADLSSFKMASPADLATARDFGPLDPSVLALLLAELASPIDTLSEAKRLLALANLTPPAANTLSTTG